MWQSRIRPVAFLGLMQRICRGGCHVFSRIIPLFQIGAMAQSIGIAELSGEDAVEAWVDLHAVISHGTMRFKAIIEASKFNRACCSYLLRNQSVTKIRSRERKCFSI